MFAKIDNPQRKYENDQTEFIKIKPNRKESILKGLGHSQITSNNFSRRNSIATIASSGSSTDSTSRTANNLNTSYKPHSQQSWSMPHLNNIDNIAYKDDELNKNNYKLTERRCNYERIVQHQLRQQLLQSRSSKQVVSSRISTFSADRNQCQYYLTKSCDSVSKDFLDLSEFRKQNSKDCFSEHRQQECFLHHLPEQCMTQNNFHKLKCKELKMNANTFKYLSSSTMPYAMRQRMLRDELAKDLQRQNKLLPAVNKSSALSYQQMY